MAEAIRVENLSKAYQLGEIGTGTLSKDFERWLAKVRGKEDPFLKIGETNDRTSKGSSDIVWSLKDINFSIEQGDAVGIIGRNGAGKSTLLKLLSRVTSPTTGSIKVKGRIASLLEVGTGFHPELTGRENIYLNGAILGMRKKEITRKFDEIVEFAGVERYIDTPVKRYSSGMYVRLAFAVAAHLESEILIVDEVLAVGDAEFQKKCLGKMNDVSKGEGRTVLFVSHNMGSVMQLCNSGILLQNGNIIYSGDVEEVINIYTVNASGNKGSSSDESSLRQNQKLKIRRISVLNESGSVSSEIYNNQKAFIEVCFEIAEPGSNYNVSVEISHFKYGIIFSSTLKDYFGYASDINLSREHHTYKFELPMEILREGDYYINAGSAIPKVEILDIFKYQTTFSVIDLISPVAKSQEGREGAILPVIEWHKMN